MSGEAHGSIQIRRAEISDAVEIARLSNELGYPVDTKDIAIRLDILLPHPNHFIAVAYAEPGKLLGWAATERRLLLESGARAELIGLVVDASARRMGIGKMLVIAAEDWADAQGLHTMTLRSNVVRQESHPFYARLGYSLIKTQHAYAKQLGR